MLAFLEDQEVEEVEHILAHQQD
jgi:hypothetical protein